MSDWICPDISWERQFVVFENGFTLNVEPIEDGDLIPVKVPLKSTYAAQAWSANAPWFFVVDAEGITLASVNSQDGWRCKRRTLRFVELFVEAPYPKAGRGRARNRDPKPPHPRKKVPQRNSTGQTKSDHET